MELAGAKVVPFSPVHDACLAGSGRHLHRWRLSGALCPRACLKIDGMRRSLQKAHERDMPIYAECGGLMYLAREIEWDGERQEMVGLVPGIVRRGSIRVVSYVHGRLARDLPARARGRADHGP